MTPDFVRRILRPERPDWIIRSLMDIDFYKFTMGYFIFRNYPKTNVAFAFINRHLQIPVALLVDEEELRAQLEHVRTLRFRRTDIYYLRGMDVYGQAMFTNDFFHFLENLQLPPYTLKRVGDQYDFKVEAPWVLATWWETIFLAIISELLYRTVLNSMVESGHEGEMDLRIMYGRATDKVYGKLQAIKQNGAIRFADFGQRRRHSFLWQKFVIEMAHEVLGPQFTGTSNTWMAFNQDLVPIGTNAHELPMVLTALEDTDEGKQNAQYEVVRKWWKLYSQEALRIMLPDTYGSRQFFNNMPASLAEDVAHTCRGMRQDSGDPTEEGEFFISWLKRFGVDSKKKLFIPSDGLDVGPMESITAALGDRITLSHGWGTKFTNDFGDCHPHGNDTARIHGTPIWLTWNELLAGHSFVCKVASADNRPAVKLSNNVNKATGPNDEVERYIAVFGHEGRIKQEVLV